MKQKQNINNIFVDTNVLIGYYTDVDADVSALKYLFSLNGKILFVSALSIAQLVALFQNRKLKTAAELRTIIRQIKQRFSILAFSENEIDKSITIKNDDLEDNMQYSIGQKMRCYYYVTNNTKDFNFYNIKAILPQKVRIIER